MSTMSKGLAVQFAAVMISGIVAAGILSAAIEGPIQDTLLEGLTTTEDSLDEYSGTIEIKDVGSYTAEERLSQAAEFVYHRARGCSEVKDEYPALQDSPYTSSPDCGGFKTPNPAKRIEGSANDFEGYAGSVKFRVTGNEPVVLATSEEAAQRAADTYGATDGAGDPSEPDVIPEAKNTWLEDHLLSASKNSYAETIRSSCPADPYGGFDSPEDQYNIFFATAEEPDGRVDGWMDENNIEEYVFCGGAGDKPPVYNKFEDPDVGVIVQLCPGDEGYIQVNKGSGKPFQEGEAGAPAGGTATGAQGFWPFIEITKLGSTDRESCGRVSSDPPELSVEFERRDPSGVGSPNDVISVRSTVENRRVNDDYFEFFLAKQPGKNQEELRLADNPTNVDGWKSKLRDIESGESREVTLEVHPSHLWACDTVGEGESTIALWVNEVGGSWSEARNIDISSIVDKCGGELIPRAEFTGGNSVVAKDPLIGIENLKVTASIRNPSIDSGRFELTAVPGGNKRFSLDHGDLNGENGEEVENFKDVTVTVRKDATAEDMFPCTVTLFLSRVGYSDNIDSERLGSMEIDVANNVDSISRSGSGETQQCVET